MPQPFDLFYLFVENVFGGILMSILGLLALFTLICMISRMSKLTTIFILGLFVMTVSIGYVGGIAVLLWGIIALYWAFSGVQKFVTAVQS